MKRKNYTLVEILTVAVIIAILLAGVVGLFALVKSKNADRTTQITIKLMETAFEKYREKTGAYPAEKAGSYRLEFPMDSSDDIWKCISDVTLNGNNVSGIRGVRTRIDGSVIVILDGWDNDLLYRSPGEFNKSTYDLGSRGADGKYGNGGTAYQNDFGKGDDMTNFRQAE